MKVITTNLNQAAFFVALGAKLLHIERRPHSQWDFELQVSWWMMWYEKHLGWLPYQRYLKTRTRLKRQFYDQYGLYVTSPFRGEREGNVFHDVIHVRDFTKNEQQHLKL